MTEAENIEGGSHNHKSLKIISNDDESYDYTPIFATTNDVK